MMEVYKECTDRVCENIDLAKLAEKIVSWEKCAPYCGLSPADEMEIKENSRQYGVQKRQMLERWKKRSGEDATYRNLAVIFEKVEDQTLADFALKLAQDQRETESNNCSIRKWNLMKCLLALLVLIALIAAICFAYQSVKYSFSKNFTLYADKVKQRYKIHLRDVAQSFWLPADMHTFIQLSLTSRDKPHAPKVDQDSSDERIVSERSMSFDDLLSEIDASPGSRIIVVGQPGIGKTTLLQRITRYWAHDRALSSCSILLHIVLRDLVLLQHAPNLTTFLSFMGSITLPPDIETFVLESDGKGLCFIADGLDEYPAGYEDKANFIFSQLIGAQKPNIKLPQSTIVISSRPEVVSQVRHLFDKRIDVLGFGDDQINEYIQAKYGEDKSFSSYLDDHPHIKHTCYIPLHLAMLVYLKDSLLDNSNLPETETEIYEQFIIYTLIRDFCKPAASSCSHKNMLPTSLNNVDELHSPEIESLLFHIANLSYNGIQRRQSIFKENEVGLVLQHTNSSLLVVDKISVLQPTTYSFPHLTIQEFLAAFYFNVYLTQHEQKRVLVEYSNQSIRHTFWKFCCGLKRNENQTTFLEFFNLLYHFNNASGLTLKSLSQEERYLYSWVPEYNISKLPFYCAHEAQSIIAAQQLINSTGGIAELSLYSYYDVASVAFVVVSAAEDLREISNAGWDRKYVQFFLQKLCDATTNYSQLRKIQLHCWSIPSKIKCLLQKSPSLESLAISSPYLWLSDGTARTLPPYGLKGLYMYIYFAVDDKKTPQHLLGLNFLETLGYYQTGDDGASTIAELMKALPHLQHVRLGRNGIGGNGAALLWNQSIHKCCNLDLDGNVIGNDRPDAFISALVGTVNNEYERNKSCQLEVSMFDNRFLCSDRKHILAISKNLPKGVTLKIGSNCWEMTEKITERFIYYVLMMMIYAPYNIKLQLYFLVHKRGLQFIIYLACTFFLRTPLWGLYCFCCFTIYILSSFDYLVQVDYFIFIVSLLWSWIVVGRLIFRVSLKLLPKPWVWVLILAVMMELYFTDFKLIDYQLFTVLYILSILGYILFDLGLFPLWYYVGISCSEFNDRLWLHLGYEFFVEVLKIGLHC